MSYGHPPPGHGPNRPTTPQYPQGAYPQNAYGPPPAQAGPAWYGQSQPPAKKSKKGLVIAIVAVVLAAAGGVGGWLWLGGGSGSDDVGFAPEAQTQLTMTFKENFPEDWTPDASTARASVGSWLDGEWWTEQHLVREMWNEIVAYNLDDFSVAWQLPVEGNGACKASSDVSPEGYVAVMRGKPMTNETGPNPCDQLTLVDINAGEEIWTTTITPGVASVLPDATDRPVVWGQFVSVPTSQGLMRFQIEDGTQLEAKKEDCRITAYGVRDDTLLGWRLCEEAGSTLIAFGRDGAEPLWAWDFPGGGDVTVLSADPLIVAVRSDDDQQVWRVEPGGPDDPGEHTVLLEMASDNLDPMPPCLSQSGCVNVVVGDDVLYLKYAMDPDYDQVGIVAFDLESGDERWRARANGELSLTPVSVAEDGRLIAFQPQEPPLGDDEGSRAAIVAVDPDSGDITPLAGLPMEDGSRKWLLAKNSLGDEIVWRDGRFAIVIPEVIVADDASGGGPGSIATVIYS